MQVEEGCKVAFLLNGRRMERLLSSRYQPEKTITLDSPVGRAIRGRMAGDRFRVYTPAGPSIIKIIEVVK